MGGSGMVGSKLMEELVLNKAYRNILSIGRTRPAIKSDKVEHLTMDFKEIQFPDARIKGHDLFIAFGTTRARAGSKRKFKEVDYDYPLNVIKSAYANGVNQVLLVSAVGADPDSLFFYSRIKGYLELALCKKKFWSTHIFRPSLLLGDRNKNRFGESIAQVLGKGLNILTGGMVYKYKPVEAEVVARAMIMAAQMMEGGRYIYTSTDIQRLADNYGNKLKINN